MEHTGNGNTLRTTLLVSVQPVDSVTVNCKVALAEETYAVVISEVGESIVAVPATTLQVVEAIGCTPAVALPCNGNAVESPWVQRAWLGPGLALGPTFKLYCSGGTKSSIVALLEAEALVLTMIVLKPTEAH